MSVVLAEERAYSSKVGRGLIYNDITQTIGNTPLVRLGRLMVVHDVKADILAKIESFNPAGSVKDRSAFAMIESLEAAGRIGPETELIEATSGNNGVSCAWVCAIKGIPLTIVMPEHMSVERRKMQGLFGAKLVLTPKKLGTKGAIDTAEALLAENPNMVMVGQFENPANPAMHRSTTAEEIWTDTGGTVDAIILGIGTGGTFTGIAEALKPRNPDLRMIAVEPASCPVLSQCRSGAHKLQGLSSGHVPEILRTELIDEVVTVEDDDAIGMARDLARIEAIAVGISSGAAAVAAVQVGKRIDMVDKTIVTILADFAERYISTEIFDDM